MEMKVRGYIRIIGIIVGLLGYFSVFLMITTEEQLNMSNYSFIFFSPFLFLPLVLSSSILGRVPFFITKFIPNNQFEDLLHAERFFKEISPKTIGFAIGFFITASITIYFWG